MTPKLFTTLKTYTRAEFGADLFAGVTVALVALPLSIAIAIASGAAPAAGFVTAIVAGFLISALGGSRVQIGGPTGAFIVVVAGVIATHGYDGLVAATFLAGIVLVIAGLFRAGQLVRHVPEAVINGFTIGIAVIIATSQIPDFLGLAGSFPADFLEKIPALVAALPALNPASLATGLVTMALIVLLRRAFPRLPGLIVAVALTSAAVALLDLPVETIRSRFGELPQSLPAPRLPELSLASLRELLPSALVIAFLAGVESLLSAMVADRMIGGRHRSNAELMAQGWANIGSSLFGGLPATGAIARTATNVRAGGKTPVAGIIHSLTLLAIMMLAAPLAGYLALPALSGLLLLTAWNMSEPNRWGAYLRSRPSDRALLLITLVLTVVTDLTVAIGTGIALGLALRLARRGVDDPDWTPRDK
ncbi:SulP family inorganic anion transporter [Celeribacter indicus]|uniref:Sulfate permease n=1 Tax=Celeribacter indicus TaxID=1208324 RepID=A0A0B5DWZ9_9RHOB|nr:SulP family inorganic anion transporter [Celeribacter indicus]AJE44737.1 sulfate permease [Celeribacter indicus]SDX49945.1 sulfate permease, SulP family [Celeribacter indicus]